MDNEDNKREINFGPDIHVHPARDTSNEYTLGVVVYGVATLVLLTVAAVMLGDKVAVMLLAASASMAYFNYTFLHALRGGYMQSMGKAKLLLGIRWTATMSMVFVGAAVGNMLFAVARL